MKHFGTICCWKCKKPNATLTVCRDEHGKKTQDYVCEKCKAWTGLKPPDIGNQSVIYNKEKEKHD
jgi:protein-arginine kinase activator protein McsA